MNEREVSQRDEGVVLVWVALMLVVLLGVGALVIDIGRLYVERRQLQNGADAAALAVAQDCAEGNCEDEVGTAQKYADLNANDNTSALEPGTPCGKHPDLTPCDPVEAPEGIGSADWVRVGTSTRTSNGDDEVSFLLAPIISTLTGQKVRASASAAWGTLGAGRATPLVFSQCEWAKLSGDLPIDGDFESFPGTIIFHGQNPNAADCDYIGPSGFDGPGGFGRVKADDPPVPGTDAGCSVTLAVGDWVPVDTGNDLGRACDVESWRNQVVEVAVFDVTNDRTGNNLKYRIVGFVGFEVSGYNLPAGGGGKKWGSCDPSPGNPVPKGGDTYLCGKFVSYTTLSGSLGSGTPFGAQVIKMVE